MSLAKGVAVTEADPGSWVPKQAFHTVAARYGALAGG